MVCSIIKAMSHGGELGMCGDLSKILTFVAATIEVFNVQREWYSPNMLPIIDGSLSDLP